MAINSPLDGQTPPLLVPGDGFVQLEGMEMQVPSRVLEIGQTFTVKYFYANRGGLPVYEVQTWGLMQILDPDLNPAGRLKEVMLTGVKDGHQKFPTGSTLGVGISNFSFAPLSESLTENQMASVKAGTLSVFLLIGGVWKDNRNEFHYWVECRRAKWPSFPSVENFNWLGL
jgi:hypothetical protein